MVDSLTGSLGRIHPRPFAHTLAADFTRRSAVLRALTGNDDDMLAGVVRLVASLEDGHTFVSDLGPAAGRWYPVRFYRFADGLWVSAATAEHAALIGGKVLRLDATPVDTALARIDELAAGDNAFGRGERVALLSNAVLLKALRIAPSEDSLRLVTSRGASVLRAVETRKGDLTWTQFGEVTGPSELTFVSAFKGRTISELRDPTRNADLPLYARGRRAYWWTYLPRDSTIYFALNNIVGKSGFSNFTLLEELQQALGVVDSAPDVVNRFVLDLRFNSGGDGTLTPAIVNELVKRESTIGRRGRLFVVTGGKTFSAAAGTVIDIMRHTSAVLVGEPMGVAYNACGDAGQYALPRQIRVSISTICSRNTSLDDIRVIPVQLPAVMTGEAYFASRDPVMETILSAPAPYRDVLATLERDGGAAARALWTNQQRQFGALEWWQPFTYAQLNGLSYRLVQAQRIADGVVGFELNAERFPDRWEVWDSLGDGYRAAGRLADAKAGYERALRVAPDNWNASNQKKAIAELSVPPARHPDQ